MNPKRSLWIRNFTIAITFMVVPLAQAMIWAESYASMIERAELIFIGTLSETKTYKLKETIYPFRSEPERAKEVKGLYTDHIFKVDQVLKGKYSESSIAISQFGGFDGGFINGSRQMLYFLSIGQQYLIMAVHSEITPSQWMSASYGLGVLEITDREGKSYLESVSKTKGIQKQGDSGSKIETEIPLEQFIEKIGGSTQ